MFLTLGTIMLESDAQNIANFSLSFLINKIHDTLPALWRILCIATGVGLAMWLGNIIATTLLSSMLLEPIPLYLSVIVAPVITLYALVPLTKAFLKKIVLPESIIEKEILTIANKHQEELSPALSELCSIRLQQINKRITIINNCPDNIIEANSAGLIGAAGALTTAYLIAPVAVNGIIPIAMTTVIGSNLGNFAYDTWSHQATIINPENLQLAAGIPYKKPSPV